MSEHAGNPATASSEAASFKARIEQIRDQFEAAIHELAEDMIAVRMRGGESFEDAWPEVQRELDAEFTESAFRVVSEVYPPKID